jgi:hypothetical protein
LVTTAVTNTVSVPINLCFRRERDDDRKRAFEFVAPPDDDKGLTAYCLDRWAWTVPS